MKINSAVIDDTINKLRALLPEDVSEFKRAKDEKVKLILNGMIEKLDLVSRNEYEVQTEVLRRTRERIRDLEQRIAILEQNQN